MLQFAELAAIAAMTSADADSYVHNLWKLCEADEEMGQNNEHTSSPFGKISFLHKYHPIIIFRVLV